MTFDFGIWLNDILGPLGTLGLLIGIFLFFYIDAIIFPTLPELVAIAALAVSHPPFSTPVFAVIVLITILSAELLGLWTLYFVAKNLSIPKKVEGAINRYTRFLVVKDEKIILVNRLAPVLPFMGAFVAVCHWNFRKSVLYTVIGGLIKYSIILASGTIFYEYLDSGQAFTVSIILVLCIISISVVISFLRRDKILGPGNQVDPVCKIEEK
jgi:membrane protein DedA with SNARE-associated domain